MIKRSWRIEKEEKEGVRDGICEQDGEIIYTFLKHGKADELKDYVKASQGREEQFKVIG